MKMQPGRKSAAAVETAALMAAKAKATRTRRPSNPPTTPLQRQIDSIVATKARGYFNHSDMLLVSELARHMLRSDGLEKMLAGTDYGADPEDFKRLCNLASKESALVLAFARCLRLCPMNRYRGDAAVHNEQPADADDSERSTQTAYKPWEDRRFPPGCDPKYPRRH